MTMNFLNSDPSSSIIELAVVSFNKLEGYVGGREKKKELMDHIKKINKSGKKVKVSNLAAVIGECVEKMYEGEAEKIDFFKTTFFSNVAIYMDCFINRDTERFSKIKSLIEPDDDLDNVLKLSEA